MAVQQGFVFEYLRSARLLVSYQGSTETALEWERYLAFLGTVSRDAMRFMVYVDGAAPSPAHLQRLAGLVRGHQVTAALVSPSLALRFAVSAFTLVTRSIRYFTPEQLLDALAHIRCSEAESRLVQEALQRLQRAP